jgi:hypothetical protein
MTVIATPNRRSALLSRALAQASPVRIAGSAIVPALIAVISL